MKSLAIISIIGLALAIILGFTRNANVGIISIGIAFIISQFYGISANEIISGFNTSLFLTMLGVTYLFSIVNSNDTLTITAKKIVKSVGKKTWLLPIVLFIMGFFMSFIGPGAIPCLAIMPIIAVPIALQSGFNPIMLSIIGIKGAQAARMSPITPEGILVHQLLAEQGILDAVNPVFISMFLMASINAIVAFIVYKGWKPKKSIEVEEETLPKFNSSQIISIVGLLTMMVCALFFKMNVGLVAFTIGSILVILGVVEDSKAIKAVPWNVLLLVTGVGILMEIILQSGGIDIIISALSSVMSEKTSAPIMVLVSGIMSFFSSGLGVVFPTLIPTVSGITANVGGISNAIELASMVVIGGTFTGISPISTAGALIMAAISSNEEATKLYPNNKIFTELFGWAFLYLIVDALVTFTGIFNFIATTF
ncbi:Na+/H+ antiporter NhaD [Anaerosphaera aminiphila DSM 21120]|uniref:Na+/H+ antiporter NhaD n=1 Tax=Anaerosphaera aminiphila DSM 21120 TaxID=1120995 RepID=A0A1M5TBS7_9FIRM|nr:SLC13 family permease [Anaerosphaera aminiphila]SHH48169.1 Na+/H+ antiporter NhaD [Anaerosphaera aminiphila DSM 21120]